MVGSSEWLHRGRRRRAPQASTGRPGLAGEGGEEAAGLKEKGVGGGADGEAGREFNRRRAQKVGGWRKRRGADCQEPRRALLGWKSAGAQRRTGRPALVDKRRRKGTQNWGQAERTRIPDQEGREERPAVGTGGGEEGRRPGWAGQEAR